MTRLSRSTFRNKIHDVRRAIHSLPLPMDVLNIIQDFVIMPNKACHKLVLEELGDMCIKKYRHYSGIESDDESGYETDDGYSISDDDDEQPEYWEKIGWFDANYDKNSYLPVLCGPYDFTLSGDFRMNGENCRKCGNYKRSDSYIYDDESCNNYKTRRHFIDLCVGELRRFYKDNSLFEHDIRAEGEYYDGCIRTARQKEKVLMFLRMPSRMRCICNEKCQNLLQNLRVVNNPSLL